MSFHTIQLKGQGNNDRERIKRGTALQTSVDENRLFTCTPLIGMQFGGFHKQLQSVVEFLPRYTEEPHEFALRHDYITIAFTDDLHIVAPIKITALIERIHFRC